MTIFQELKRRNLIAQMSHEEEIEQLLAGESVKFYTGFDATADSLHVGHLVPIITMSRLQKAGHQPFALLGTATTLIGDPSGKTDMRKMLDDSQIAHNAECFREQMSRFIEFAETSATPQGGLCPSGGLHDDAAPDKAQIVRNGDWFADVKYLEFLRDVGRHFTINRMLAAECFKSRLDSGLTFLEFNYMLLQSYDFLHLFRTHDVKLQLGGDDQWSNILAGADLVRRVEQSNAFGMTFSLLLTSDGKKMGKTEKGALWLDADRCSPYDFFQYFRNVADADVINTLKMMTFVDVEQIEDMEKSLHGKEFNAAKELLAFEMTKMVHGQDEAVKARDAAKNVFMSGGVDENMPTVTVSSDKINILDLLVETKLCGSKRDARTNTEQGGVSVNDEKITDVNAEIVIDDFVIIKKGKKNIIKAVKP